MTNKFIEQRVEALENELSELKLIVAQIRKPSTVVEENPKSPFHTYLEDLAELEKSPNQIRVEIIEKAKAFIRQCKKITSWGAYGYLVPIPEGQGSSWVCDVKFEINESKRAVTALIYWKPSHYKKGELKAKGIAKCNPSDVFNEHIGKAIALGRALGLDVSEFEQAVQPTLAVGQIVYFTNSHGANIHYQIDSTEIIDDEPNLTIVKDYGKTTNGTRSFATFGGNPDVKAVIINDTNAQYGGIE